MAFGVPRNQRDFLRRNALPNQGSNAQAARPKETQHKVFFGVADTEGRIVTSIDKPTYRVGSVEGYVTIPYTDEFQSDNVKSIKTIIYFMYAKPNRGDNIHLVDIKYNIYAKFYDKFILVQPKDGLVSINPQHRAFIESDLFSAAREAASRSLGAKLLGR